MMEEESGLLLTPVKLEIVDICEILICFGVGQGGGSKALKRWN